MQLSLSPEQLQIVDAVAAFAKERSPVARSRALRDSRDPTGFSRSLWSEMSTLGWIGMTVPEAHGGMGLGLSEAGIVLEQLARVLAPEPYLSTAVLGVEALRLGASDELQTAVLPGVVRGDRVLALAWQEQSRFDPYRVRTSAERCAGGYRLCGEKRAVIDGHVADDLLVVARTSGMEEERRGLSLFAVSAQSPGLSIRRTRMIDGRSAAIIRLEDVEVSVVRVLGPPGEAAGLLDALLDRASAALSAELVGLYSAAFELTVDYLKVREQFGVKIGSFQALKHRAAQMFCDCELARSLARGALFALDAGDPDASRLASAAKAACSEVALHITGEAIQMHGGLGMTDDHDAGLYLKRARVTASCLGDPVFQRDRFARLSGY